jgi:serine/threonine protein kinase
MVVQANVLVTPSGFILESLFYSIGALADFGLATAIDSKTISMTHNSTTKTGGTLGWQAPKLYDPFVHQQNSKTTDIYALGCVCYEVRISFI